MLGFRRKTRYAGLIRVPFLQKSSKQRKLLALHKVVLARGLTKNKCNIKPHNTTQKPSIQRGIEVRRTETLSLLGKAWGKQVRHKTAQYLPKTITKPHAWQAKPDNMPQDDKDKILIGEDPSMIYGEKEPDVRIACKSSPVV